MTGLEGFVMLLPWFRSDILEDGVIADPFKWFQWGYIKYYMTGEIRAWYILVRLPSYLMQEPWWAYCDAPPVWHQRCLVFREPIPAGKSEWRQIVMECP